MPLTTNARFLQFQQLMECTISQTLYEVTFCMHYENSYRIL